jgi:predicted GH43/DUF377 family glycosyl hydrolase
MITPSGTTVTEIELWPDPSRVLAKPFVPGLEDVGPMGSRAGAVVERIMRLSEDTVEATLQDVTQRFGSRHRYLDEVFHANAERLIPLLDPEGRLDPARRRLLGAYFTHEYSVEGAALANPSIVPHPQQSEQGCTRFVMSVRCIGEGHRSAIGFRTGKVTTSGDVSVDPPSRYVTPAPGGAGVHHRRVFHTRLDHLGHNLDEVSQLLALLPPVFDDNELAAALQALSAATPRLSPDLISHATDLSHWSYEMQFPAETELSERILWPHAPPEYHGMEDARFVRFVDDAGDVTYFATYTAFDRSNISMQLLETRDFRSFASSPIAGAAAVGKGLALFPRTIGGRHAAVTRSDRESNGIAFSDDLRHWPTAEALQIPQEPWELIQIGNCGSPVETEDGWLVLTHGVGPMRTYCIGALLLDLEQPNRVLRRTVTPILEPDAQHREGYVPNVVYSCGGMICGDTLVLPFGIADQRIGVATLSVTALIRSMQKT